MQTIKNIHQSDDLIVCADGGATYAVDFGLTPHAVVGDFDSLAPELLEKLKKEKTTIINYPSEKDQTDAELAIFYAVSEGCKNIILFAAFGNRIDHFLAILFYIAKKQKAGIKFHILENNQELFLVDKAITLSGKIGDFVSLIPLQGDVIGITTKALKYSLENATLKFGETRGVSNEFIDSTAKISITSGLLLVIQTKSG